MTAHVLPERGALCRLANLDMLTRMKRIAVALLLTAVVFAAGTPAAQKRKPRPAAPKPAAPKPAAAPMVPLLTYDEVVELYKHNPAPAALEAKKSKVLNTPFVDNSAADRGVRPRSVDVPGLGRSVRVAFWNIERGIEFDAIVAAFRGPEALAPLVDGSKIARDSEDWKTIMRQAETLVGADVVVLNELDWGMRRSGYRNVPAELAAALGMNYAYGVEFIECDPISTGTETFDEAKPEERAELVANIAVDKSKFRGMHGTAILSRYRLENVKITRLPKVYDWYWSELNGTSKLESGKRKASEKILLEKFMREVRRGSRMYLTADITEPAVPGGKVTIVATHLENRCVPKLRVEQLNAVLGRIASIGHPVVIAGDMNTSTSDGTPTSVSREVKKRVGSADFWAKKGIFYATGVGFLGSAAIGLANTGRKYGDPTVKNIRIVGSNPEAKFFETLRKYRFVDGKAFDFRGDKDRTANGRSGTLANSNERDDKGFVISFEVERTVASQGKLKLDWIFVKPLDVRDPDDDAQPYRFAPHFAQTFKDLNYAIPDRISDHNPMVVDLPFDEPTIPRR